MNTTLLIAVVVAVSIIAAVSAYQEYRKKQERREWKEFECSYLRNSSLFSKAERSFFGVLQDVVGERAYVFGKIRVADVLEPEGGLSRSDSKKGLSKISSKHFDFVLCRKTDLSFICAIELNDSSHKLESAKERDEILERACRTARFPLLWVPAQRGYVREKVEELLSPYFADLPEAEKNCPKCSTPLVRKTAKKGKNPGDEFLACDNFPDCRYTETLPS